MVICMIDFKSIDDPSFVKKLSKKELYKMPEALRSFLIENVSKTGGHLSSNLGVVELTLAMYYVFDLEHDEFLFDVGHQSYVHKILSGRAKNFETLRQYNGLSGFINRNESKYDIWESGHSSTSISAATGLMLGDNTKREIVVIGDTSIMNGVAFEGLNFLGQFKTKNPIIILNDNEMGISKSVGALSQTFKRLVGSKASIKFKNFITKVFPNFVASGCHKLRRFFKIIFKNYNIFESMGFDYHGPYNGNDLKTIIKVLKRVKKCKKPVVLHVKTIKGKGYIPSEEDKIGDFHGVSPFNIETGKPKNINNNKLSYSKLVATYLVNKRKANDFYVITPAMKAGSKLEEFSRLYPNNFYDVGIAEEHAAVMAAGIALRGKDVVLLYYSTFAQRAYDQILNDIARGDLKVIIGIDRAGIVGEDGVTHQGLYDISMFSAMPNIVVTMPKDEQEAIGLFNYGFTQNHPYVVRYPRATEEITLDLDYSYICENSWEILKEGKKAIVISYGPDVKRIASLNLDIMVVNARFIKPYDEAMLNKIFDLGLPIIVFEQAISSGTLYHNILDYKEKNNLKSKVYSHTFGPNTLIPHGSINDIYESFGFSNEAFINKINEVIE